MRSIKPGCSKLVRSVITANCCVHLPSIVYMPSQLRCTEITAHLHCTFGYIGGFPWSPTFELCTIIGQGGVTCPIEFQCHRSRSQKLGDHSICKYGTHRDCLIQGCFCMS